VIKWEWSRHLPSSSCRRYCCRCCLLYFLCFWNTIVRRYRCLFFHNHLVHHIYLCDIISYVVVPAEDTYSRNWSGLKENIPQFLVLLWSFSTVAEIHDSSLL
jgi:hypothetical protein